MQFTISTISKTLISLSKLTSPAIEQSLLTYEVAPISDIEPSSSKKSGFPVSMHGESSVRLKSNCSIS
tara:strand:- start:2239 stop:2442 length:204 start_codon:yes stop_codon:yes gene_type:complete